MNTGDYVRLNNSVYNVVVINRIAEIFEDTILTENDGSMYQGEYAKEEIIKSSPNIIDLIEVGDYVNGIYIDGNNGKYLETLEHDMENSSLGHIEYYRIWDNDIKTIITKEQIEQMEYKVGE